MNQHLHSLLLRDLQGLYDMEHQLIDALPIVADMTTHSDLREALLKHRDETREQAKKLEDAFRHLNAEPLRTICIAMEAIIREGMQLANTHGTDEQSRNAAIIGAANKVEHYEMGAYESAWMLATAMEHTDVADILEHIREQEQKTSGLLRKMDKNVLDISMIQMARGLLA